MSGALTLNLAMKLKRGLGDQVAYLKEGKLHYGFLVWIYEMNKTCIIYTGEELVSVSPEDILDEPDNKDNLSWL